MAGLAHRNPGSSGSSGCSCLISAGAAGRWRAAHRSNPCAAMAAIMRRRLRSGSAIGRGRENRHETRSGDVVPRLLRDRPILCRASGRRARSAMARARSLSPPVHATSLSSPSGGATNTTAQSASSVSRTAAAVSCPSSSGNAAASTSRRTTASSASMEESGSVASTAGNRDTAFCVSTRSRAAPRDSNIDAGERKLVLGLRAGADPAGEASER